MEATLVNAVQAESRTGLSASRKYRVSDELCKFYFDKGEYSKCHASMKSMLAFELSDAERSTLYNRLAHVSLRMNDVKSALAHLSNQSLLARKAYRPDSREMADSFSLQVRLLELCGQHAKALECNARARSLHQSLKLNQSLISDFEDLAFVQRNGGDEDSAQRSLSTAIDFAFDGGVVDKAVHLSMELAARQFLQGREADAQATVRKLLDFAANSEWKLASTDVADLLQRHWNRLAPDRSKSISGLRDWLIELY